MTDIVIADAESVHPLTPAAIQRSADHRYSEDGGKTWLPSVTTILGILDKSGPLMHWAARQTAEAAVAMLDEIAPLGMTRLEALREDVGDEGTIKALTSRSTWKRDEAAQLGSRVHELADMYVGGQLPDTTVVPYETLKRVRHYAAWWDASGWKLRLSEAMVINRNGYGGTFDLLAYDREGRTVLADIKTGRAIYREAVLQLTAYEMADVVAPAGSPVAYPMPPVDRMVVLHVTEEGVREVEIPIEARAREAFYACLTLHEWAEAQKGRKL